MAKARLNRKSSRDQEPELSRAEKESLEVEKEILQFWNAIAECNVQKWDKPWVNNIFLGENAGKFLMGEPRYFYRGGFNQFLLAKYAGESISPLAHLVLNRSDIQRIFGVDSFVDTPVLKAGVKSIGSLFKAPSSFNYFVDQGGQIWKGEQKPTPQQIAELGLTQKSSGRKTFGSFPVWSLEDVYDHLPDEIKLKADELVSMRTVKGYEYNPDDQLDSIVDAHLQDIIQRQGISTTQGGNRAFYRPSEDAITVPANSQFKNPIARFAVTVHELAHSTKPVTGRNLSRNERDYAIEEVVAETTAVLLVNRLKLSLATMIEARPEVEQMFADYYSNAMIYNKGWGHEFDFIEHVRLIGDSSERDKGLIKTILVKIAKAADALVHQSFTPEQRREGMRALNEIKLTAQSSTPDPT